MQMESIRRDVLDACRGLAAYGMGTGIGGQVSVRIPGEDLMVSHAFDKTFEEMQEDDILVLPRGRMFCMIGFPIKRNTP